MRYLLLLLSFLAVSIAPQTSYAQDESDNLVKIRLLAERTDVKGGEEIWIGTEQSIEPHWHTYWKNPGDSGTPTSVKWNLPEGFEASDIQWPTPKKLPFGPLLNYGYENSVLLPQKLKLPETLPTGEITLNADIELLVCKEECIPEYGTYTLTLNGEPEDNAAYYDLALEKLPTPTDWEAQYYEEENNFILEITADDIDLQNLDLTKTEFIPADWGLLRNASPTEALIQDGTLIIKQARDDRPIDAVKSTNGVLKTVSMDGKEQSFEITAGFNSPLLSDITNTDSTLSIIGVLNAVILALIGGLILNLMPCVFPVLSLKALSLCKTAEKDPAEARMHGIAYTAGVILSFLAIAGALIALQAGGSQIGWGFQLQNPLVVGLLGYLLFIIGLNLIGFFEFANPFSNMGGKLAQKDGASGSFFTGVLATLVATPCTAPFMAGAIGYALVQPPAVSLVIFASLGLGLALPYLILSFVPSAQKALPKPGPWMDIFKQILAFPMFGAALWLFWVLAQQTGSMGATAVLIGTILISFGIWVLKLSPKKRSVHFITRLLAIIAFGASIALIPAWSMNENVIDAKNLEFGESFTPVKLETALQSSDPVFTEMTAAWCITCKVNNAVAININNTKKLFADEGVKYLVGDWTNEDPEITKYLQKYGRSGVPLYVFYGSPDPVTNQRPEPKVLPQVLTPGIVKDTIKGS